MVGEHLSLGRPGIIKFTQTRWPLIYVLSFIYAPNYVPCPPLDKSFERYLVNFAVKLKLDDGYFTIPFRALVSKLKGRK